MLLIDKQRAFCLLWARLIVWSFDHGYALSEDWPPELWSLADQRKSGHQHGRNLMRFTRYINVAVDGRHRTDVHAYQAVAAQWLSMNHLCRWGGECEGESRGMHRFSMAYVAGRASDGFVYSRPANVGRIMQDAKSTDVLKTGEAP